MLCDYKLSFSLSLSPTPPLPPPLPPCWPTRVSGPGEHSPPSSVPPRSLSGTGSCCSSGKTCLPHKTCTTQKDRGGYINIKARISSLVLSCRLAVLAGCSTSFLTIVQNLRFSYHNPSPPPPTSAATLPCADEEFSSRKQSTQLQGGICRD